MILEYFNPYKNQDVTTEYLNVILYSAQLAGFMVYKNNGIFPSIKNKSKYILIVNTPDVIRAYICGYRHIILWTQGIWPEESYIRNKSRNRERLLSIIESRALRLTELVIMVSDKMKEHFQQKYMHTFSRCFVMPCFNETINEYNFINHNYYDNNFVYMGSMEKWQGIETIIRVFKEIERIYKDKVKLFIFTKEQDKAKEAMRENEIVNYEIGYVKKEEVSKVMVNMKFGFCIRENIEVNRVATPTKLSTYVCNGTIPVYSSCLESFHTIAKESDYTINIDDALWMDKLCEMIEDGPDKYKLYESFNSVFGEKYYCKEYYIDKLSNVFRSMLKYNE